MSQPHSSRRPFSSSLSRRNFVEKSALAISGGFLGLQRYSQALAQGAGKGDAVASMNFFDRHGPLLPDPDQIVDLPKGFSYRVLSRTGDKMNDGLTVPGYPDGMGAFTGADGRVVLVRNHELESKGPGDRGDVFRKLGPYGQLNEDFGKVDRSLLYDSGSKGVYPSLGGTSTLVYNPKNDKVEQEFLSLAGTERNCAGGITPWGTWLTCEESNEVPNGEFIEDHGYAFEVKPTLKPKLQKARAYKDMGRFRREAVAVDPASGIVYQTEDMGDGLFYRFIPNVPGELGKGGKVQALALVDRDGGDTRNWNDSKGPKMPEGTPLAVRWIDMDDVRSPKDDLRARGHAKGAAIFARGEGIWYGDGALYFACTNGGLAGLGQIFKYTPSKAEGKSREQAQPGQLELFIESTDGKVVQSADNLTVAPWGDLILCEDRKSNSHIRGVTADGRIYNLGKNVRSGTEFAGACFAPGLDTLFVNIQKPGLTLAIEGPWTQGV